MTVIGQCADCETPAHLRFKPDRPVDEQSQPSICDDCRCDREQQLADIRTEEIVR
ncbi:hypothetical protein [Halovivax asiaticus]|uniref:hypothetical protein n=1 Tax=Halovivax asiaticus TaxID=332953 RepID=UPI00137614DD|nr:hypothetical protein [Halovivax asiaticus]